MTDETPLVSVVCTAYNHENYIKQALDGFVMQQCKFPIEVIVHDDASTDGTSAIINEYAAKHPFIRAILQTENQYSKGFNIWEYLFTKEAKGKYIAICEGDDYWTDLLKLQKQIDFLEANQEYGLVYSKVTYFYQKKGKFSEAVGEDYKNFENLLVTNVIPTLSVVIRKNLSIQYFLEIRPSEKNWILGDWPMWIWFAKNSKLFFIDTSIGVYRILAESTSHSLNPGKMEKFIKSCNGVPDFFINYYNVLDFKTVQEIKFNKIWGLFGIACKFNIKHLFDEINKDIEEVRIKKNHVLFIKAVLCFRSLRFLFLFFKFSFNQWKNR